MPIDVYSHKVVRMYADYVTGDVMINQYSYACEVRNKTTHTVTAINGYNTALCVVDSLYLLDILIAGPSSVCCDHL